MKILRYILPVIAVFALTSCGNDNEPNLIVDFSVSCSQEYSTGEPVKFVPAKNGGTLTSFGWDYEYIFEIKGVYDYFLLAEGCPDWLSVTTTASTIKISQTNRFGESARTAVIRFAVFKGDVSSSGFIKIVQESITEEELKEREEVYMLQALVDKTVISSIPADGNFISGNDAPYYKLTEDGSVYMQVVSLGNDSDAKIGDNLFFRFKRYPLIDLINGNLTNDDGYFGQASFVLGSTSLSTTQWGTAIPLPMLLGLPYSSEVNLIVASTAGLEEEKIYYQPYFYNIRYYKAYY